MKVVKRKISELIPSEYNPRYLSDGAFAQLSASLERFGAVEPAIVNIHDDRKNIIVGGHQRIKVAQKLGWDEFPCVEVELDRDKERELNIRLNKNTGAWDWDGLANYFDSDELLEWGFNDEELFGNIEVEEPEAEEDDYEIPEEIETDFVLGDLIEIGKHRLLCGDSTDSDQVAKLMNNEKADMVFTDPPYDLENEDYCENVNLFAQNSHIFLMHDDRGIVNYLRRSELEFNRFFVAKLSFAQPRGNDPYLRHILISHETKGNSIPHDNKHDGFSSIISIEYRGTLKDEKFHKHQKSVSLVSNFIKHYSKENYLVLDLFLGSGTTMVACHQLNRKYYGLELDPKYCQVIVDRMLKLDSSLEVKVNGGCYEL